VRLDLAPPLADRFILGMVPIDCSPALLLRPFGFHLAMDTCPPEYGKQRLQVPLGYIQLRFRARLDVSILLLSPASEAITPALGMAPLHLSARGTSTLLNNALLSAHFRFADDLSLIEPRQATARQMPAYQA